MKQYPSSIKYKKNHKISKSCLFLTEKKCFYPKIGLFAIKCLESEKLKFNQVEACRKSIKRNIKRVGKLKMNPFMYFSKTAKGLGVRMGKGKGSHSQWICPVKPGYIISEIYGTSFYKGYKALKHASTRLPFKTQVIKLCY